MSDIKKNTVKKYIEELVGIINTGTEAEITNLKKIINLLFNNYNINGFYPVYDPSSSIGVSFVNPNKPEEIKTREDAEKIAAAIIELAAKLKAANKEVDLEDYVNRPDKISAAEIAAICQEAGMQAVRKNRYR